MENPSPKSAHKSAGQSSPPRGAMVRYNSPQQTMKSYSWMSSHSRDQLKEGQVAKYKIPQKPPVKENTKPHDFRLHTRDRAVQRAMFNYEVATKVYIIERQKRQIEKLHKMIEEEEIRLLRKEMVPRAQLMPFFDRPFFPQRSNRPLTVPREPSFHSMGGSKSSSFISCS